MSSVVITDRAAAADCAAPRRADPAPSGDAHPRVLVIAHRTPFPPDKGDRIRTYHVLRYLAERARVDLATLADEPVSPATRAALGELAQRVAIVPVAPRGRWVRAAASMLRGRSATEGLFASPALRRTIDAWTAQTDYDLIVAVCSSMAQYVDRRRTGDARVLVDLIDVDSQKWFDYAARSRGWRRAAYALEGRRVRRLEAELADRCDQIAVVTEAEADCFRAICRETRRGLSRFFGVRDEKWDCPPSIDGAQPTRRSAVLTIPNGVDLDYFHPNDAVAPLPDSCVFLGALDYKPNVEGVAWFCGEVWPAIRRQRPTARLSIVGRRPVKTVQDLAALPGVTLHADVPDVRPYLWQASLAVVPLHIARGVQNKVLEALAAGTPVVASPQALEGLAVTAGEQAYCAETAGQWTAAVESLLSSRSERARVAATGRAFVCQRHCWDACLAPLGDLLPEFQSDSPTR